MERKVIEGRVIDTYGNPIAGAFVTVETASSHLDIGSVSTEDGKFRLVLPDGDFSIRAVTRSGLRGEERLSDIATSKFTPIISLS